jgi:hypothetical protein
MKYIFMVIGLTFFFGCAPKYRVTTQHIMPTDESKKSCVSECQKSYGSCKEVCKANFEICKDKAEVIAKANFDKKIKEYQIRLEQWADDMEMYELEREMMYFDGFFGYGYGYPRYYHPHSIFWMGGLYAGSRPLKPRKPNLQAEIEQVQMQTCQIDCGCTKTYDSCFTGCGGEIKVDKICIENCPSDR